MNYLVVEMASEPENEANRGLLSELVGRRVGSGIIGKLTIHERTIPTPSFVIEVAGEEDLTVAIRNINLLKESHLVSVPAFKWETYTRNLPIAFDDELNRRSIEFITRHHLLSYEPPELYRFSMPGRLVSHALRDDRLKINKFYDLAVIQDKKDEALNLLPPFEREFVKRGLDSLVWRRYCALKRRNAPSLEKIKKVPEKPSEKAGADGAWSNIEEPYRIHIVDGMQQTIAMRVSTSFVPVVRTLKASSEKFVQRQVRRQNKFVVRAWSRILKGYYFSWGRPWLHLSLDGSIFADKGETQPEDVIDITNASLEGSVHCGICLTMTGWEEAWEEGRPRTRLEGFIADLSDIAFENRLPVYAARSKWIGMDLIDKGLTFAGTILNGNERLTETGGGLSSNDPRAFGTVPVYSKCDEVGILELFKKGYEIGKLESPIELHKFDGIESKCDPVLQNSHTRFRMEFAKPRRMATHTTEVREIRIALENGTLNPGRNYIKRSDLWKRTGK